MPVLIWRIQLRDELALDRYEWWPHLYWKETLRLTVNGKRVQALVYIMNANRHPYDVSFTGYFNTIQEGFASADFDTGILYDAVKRSKEAVE